MSTLATQSLSVIRLIDDYPSYCSLPDRVQSDVMSKLRWVHALLTAAHGEKQLIVKQAARELGASPGAVHRYLRWFKDHGWKGLIDERHAGVGTKGLPPQFKSWVAGIFDLHQRDNDDAMEVWRKVIDRWNLWRETQDPDNAIPGYPACPDPMPATGYPLGWSYDQIRKLKPKPAERALAKHGKKSASAFLPSVLTTRVGSRVLSRLLFDDQDYDTLLADGFLAIAGMDAASRPVSFNCVDFLTARHIDHHLRLLYKDAAGTNKTLTQQEYVWFHIKQLQELGWRTDEYGTESIFEHGTANSWANKELTSLGGHHSYEDALYAISNGKSYINRSGKFEGPVFAGMCFRAQATGNFKFKTWIESAFRLLRTYMQALPGPIGSHQRINGKDELYGIKLADSAILTAIKTCPDPEMQEFLVENFRREMLDLQTFSHLIHSVYRAINFTAQHNLEGWRRCGFTANFWRINENASHWFAESELAEIYPDPEERQLILRKINARRNVLTKIEPISREAAFRIEMKKDAHLIFRLPDPMVGLLLPREWAKTVTVGANHCFYLPNPLWPDTQDQYVASWSHKDRMITLDGGTKLLVYHNPFFDGRAQVHSLDGSYITTLHPTVRAEIFNAERTLQQLKQRSKMSSAQEAHFRARMDGIATHRSAAAAHNKELHTLARDRLNLTRESRQRSANAVQDARNADAQRTHATHGQAADDALSHITPPPDTTTTPDDLDF
jgi:hypothetical protein